MKKFVSFWIVLLFLVSVIQPAIYPASAENDIAPVNLSLDDGVGVKASSDCKGCNPSGIMSQVIDGDRATAWTYLTADIADDSAWIEINLAKTADITEVILRDIPRDKIESYTLTFKDGEGIHSVDIKAKYVTFEFTRKESATARFYPYLKLRLSVHMRPKVLKGLKKFIY
ncbi:discoidin domain-containing protein [Bacillus sp. N9]